MIMIMTITIIIIIIIIIIITPIIIKKVREVHHRYFKENQPLGFYYTEHDIVRVAHNNSMVLHTMYMYITFRLNFLNLS